MSASDVSPPFHLLFHPPLTLAAVRCLVVFVFGFVCFCLWCLCLLVFLFCKCQGNFYHSSASSRSR